MELGCKLCYIVGNSCGVVGLCRHYDLVRQCRYMECELALLGGIKRFELLGGALAAGYALCRQIAENAANARVGVLHIVNRV